MAETAAAFRRLHEGPGAFVMPNPWDVGTARVLAGLGYEALATTSGGLAFSLGRRDGEMAVSREEALEHAALIAAATPLPVSGDLENGFGHDPESVAETIRGAAAAGLAGCSIEDSTSSPGEPIYPLSQAVERIAAAVEAAEALPFPFTLTARAENYLHGRPDLDDTIARLQAFEQAGAHVLYAPLVRDDRGRPHALRGGLAAGQLPRAARRAERRGARRGRRAPRQPRHGLRARGARRPSCAQRRRCASRGRSRASRAPRAGPISIRSCRAADRPA